MRGMEFIGYVFLGVLLCGFCALMETGGLGLFVRIVVLGVLQAIAGLVSLLTGIAILINVLQLLAGGNALFSESFSIATGFIAIFLAATAAFRYFGRASDRVI
jgi:hypothetical protein